MKLLNVLHCTPKNSYEAPDVFLIVNVNYKINLISLTSGLVVFEEGFNTILELERYIIFHYEIEKIGTLIVE